MKKKRLEFQQVWDRSAIRVILDAPSAERAEQLCYEVRDIIAQMWPLRDKQKDYIGNPKSNGYRSLHLVAQRAGQPFEAGSWARAFTPLRLPLMSWLPELRLVVAEFLLTTIWVFVSQDAALSATACLPSCGRRTGGPCPPPTLNVQVSLATGFAAAVACGLTFAPKGNLGGHFNPAVSLTLGLAGAVPPARVAAFIVAQLLASLLATCLAMVVVGRPCMEDNFTMMSDIMGPTMPRLLLFTILSLVIVLVPLWAHERQGSMAVPVLVGFSYIACSLAGLPQLMDVPNLLRSFGLLLMGVRSWNMCWPTMVGSIFAALLAVAADRVVFAPDPKREEDSDEEDSHAM
ncbi:unnamed protein product [Effrenium voratum]|nr:unnamed protein product [Effrenium voratum]